MFAIAAGIILFLLVEKIVRYVEDSSGGVGVQSHGHHHHHHRHKQNKKLKSDDDANENSQDVLHNEKATSSSGVSLEDKMLDGVPADKINGEEQTANAVLRKVCEEESTCH